MIKKARLFKKRRAWITLLISIDIIAIISAFVTALALRQMEFVSSVVGEVNLTTAYVYAFIFSIVSLVFIYSAQGLYNFKNLKRINEIVLVGRAHIKWIIVLMALSYLFKYDFSRFILILFVTFSFFYSLVFRQIAALFRNWLLSFNVGLIHVIIVGQGSVARDVEKALYNYYGSGIRMLGHIAPQLEGNGIFVPTQQLLEYIDTYDVVDVYIADSNLSPEHTLNIISSFSAPNVQFKIVADIFALATGSFNVSDIDEIPTLDLGKVVPSWWYRKVKRLIDVVGSSILLVVSFPLWCLIIIAIKLDSAGPAFIAQTRIGYKGKPFTMFKFRTMHTNVPLYETAPRKNNDQRITRVGTLLRKTSLDELPQLINVLKGDMSLVGPRPEMPFIVNKYTLWQRKRLEAKPGLTGLWQILGRKDLPLVENLHYDFYYINNQSLLFDFAILFKTVPVVVFGRGAY